MKSSIVALSRRRVLLGGTAVATLVAAGAASLPSVPFAAESAGSLAPPSRQVLRQHVVARLARAFRGPEPAESLGRASLNAARIPADSALLLETLIARHGDIASALGSGDDAALHHSVHAAMRRDFAEGETLVVRGWLLARCEAEICGLICLA